MMIIPFRDPSNWKMQLELDGIIYVLEFTWNALNEFWTMDVYDRNEVPLIYGIKIVVNYSLLAPYTVFGKPPGDIVCQNIVEGDDTIRRFDMGQKFELIYYAEGELESLAEAAGV